MFGRRTLLALSLVVVAAPLALVRAAEEKPRQRVLLVGQKPDGHPPTTHEYVAGLRVLAKCLESASEIETTLASGDEPWPAGPELIKKADAVVLYLNQGGMWANADPRRLDALTALAARGGGLVVLHLGMGAKEEANIPTALKLFGGCHGGADRKYKIVTETASPAEPRHPIASGVDAFRVKEEWYYRLKFVEPPATKEEAALRPVIVVPMEGREEVVSWAWQRPDGGRSFGFSGLHFHANWNEVAYRRLAAQAVLWTLKLPIPAEGLPVKVSSQDLSLPESAKPAPARAK